MPKEYLFNGCELRSASMQVQDNVVRTKLKFRMAFNAKTAKQLNGLAVMKTVKGDGENIDPGLKTFGLTVKIGSCKLALVPDGLKQSLSVSLDSVTDFKVSRDRSDSIHCEFIGVAVGTAKAIAEYLELAGRAAGTCEIVPEADKQKSLLPEDAQAAKLQEKAKKAANATKVSKPKADKPKAATKPKAKAKPVAAKPPIAATSAASASV